ncbi:hypothetical protein EON65_29620 [archaeon]|nr:MAG: hypothetical protein EON65_29620 [archaeon]
MIESKEASDEENVFSQNLLFEQAPKANAFESFTCPQATKLKNGIIDLSMETPPLIPDMPTLNINKVLVKAKDVSIEVAATKANKPAASRASKPRALKVSLKTKAEKEFDKLTMPEKVNLLKLWNEELRLHEASSSSSSSISATQSALAAKNSKEGDTIQSSLNLTPDEKELSMLRLQLMDNASKLQELQGKEKRLKSSIKKLQRKVCASGSLGGEYSLVHIASTLVNQCV